MALLHNPHTRLICSFHGQRIPAYAEKMQTSQIIQYNKTQYHLQSAQVDRNQKRRMALDRAISCCHKLQETVCSKAEI